MADTKALLRGLEEYQASLRRHVIEVRTEFSELEKRWHSFSGYYEGDAADQFRAHWLRTVERFQEYIQRSEVISSVLEERIEYLRAANAPDPSL